MGSKQCKAAKVKVSEQFCLLPQVCIDVYIFNGQWVSQSDEIELE